MNERAQKAFMAFYSHFGYEPALGDDFYYDDDAFAEVLEKSVKDDFDYTVEKYGTVPPTRDVWDGPIID